MRNFGLIGFPLEHSFSARYFADKFKREGIRDCSYSLFPLNNLDRFPQLWLDHPNLEGLNVTIPYKQHVIPFLDGLSDQARRIGAVNVIHKTPKGLRGHNSDYFGFKKSLEDWIHPLPEKALILGTGGASKAVAVVLEDLGIGYRFVSRKPEEHMLGYDRLQEGDLLKEYLLIVNTTPLGMHPKVEVAPPIPYDQLGHGHLLYDLVYNPEETRFMQLGKMKGANVKNGHEMLVLQAEKSWEIWNSN